MDKIKYSDDINSDIYKDSLIIRETVFVKEHHVDKNIEIDNDEAEKIVTVQDAVDQIKKAVE